MPVTHDINRVDELLEVLRELGRNRLEIGIFSEDESKILMIATVHEFGVRIGVTDAMRGFLGSQGLHLRKETKYINIPERSFMRAGFDSNRLMLAAQGEALLERVVKLQLKPHDFYEVLGGICVSAIQTFMTDLRNPPNTKFTTRRKKSSNPLIDTGRMRQSITWKVRPA